MGAVHTTSPQIKRDNASLLKIKYKRNQNLILGSLAVIIFLLVWEAAVAWGWVKPLFVSSPSRIFKMALTVFADPGFYKDLRVSGTEFLAGFGLAIVVGVLLGIFMGWYATVNAILAPFVSALYATPRVALIPLIIIWFDIGISSKIAIIFLGAVFPILVNTVTGMRTVDATLIKTARSFGAGDFQIFKTVALPASIPLVLAGLRLGLGHALIGIVIGEMYAATAGIGFMIAKAGATFQTDRLMVGIILIAVVGVMLAELIRQVEKRFESWRPDAKG